MRLEPLASAPRQEVAARIGPLIERIMRGEADA